MQEPYLNNNEPFSEGPQQYKNKKELEEEERRGRWIMAEGMLNFLGVALGVLAIFALATILVSLVVWLFQDFSNRFAFIVDRFS